MKYLKKTAAHVLVILALCLVFFAVPVSAAPKFAKKKITVKAGNAFVLDIKGKKKNTKVKWKISNKARLEIISKTNYRIVLYAKKSGKVGAAGLDVYEEEADVFYEDVSLKVMRDDTLNLLLSQPNVLVTSHQAFLTDEALREIADTTYKNLAAFYAGRQSGNEVRDAAVTV